MGGSFAYPFFRDTLPFTLFHDLLLNFLLSSQPSSPNEKLHLNAFGLAFTSPLGVESDYDPNGIGFPSLLSSLGFIELGPVTPSVERSEIEAFRLSSEAAVKTSISQNFGTNWLKRQLMFNSKGPRGVNLKAPNENILAVPHLTDEDFAFMISELYPFADYFTINLACNDFYKVKYYQKTARLKTLLEKIIEERDFELGVEIHKAMNGDSENFICPRNLIPPILVKINENWENLEEIVSLCIENKIDGIVVGSEQDSDEVSRKLLEEVYRIAKGNIEIISFGGIKDGKEVLERIKRGARLVQILSVLFIQGQSVIAKINQELLQELESQKFKNINEAFGSFYKENFNKPKS